MAKPSTINLHTPHGEALENKELTKLTFGFRAGGGKHWIQSAHPIALSQCPPGWSDLISVHIVAGV